MPVRPEIVESALLLLRHRSGDARALSELLERWQRPMLYYLRRLLDSEEDAWDALQETWFAVVREQGRLRDERAFPAWLYTIARRAAGRLRRRRALEPLPGDDEPGAVPAGEPGLDLHGFDPIDVHRALAALGLVHREALTLHVLEGFSIEEVAAITGAARGTVKSRLFNARRALKARLEKGSAP